MPPSPPPEFPPEVLAEAERLAARGFDRGARRDYTSWWTCTIDDPHSHDLDDALSIRATLEGGWELAIHVADPSAFVERDSLVDEHAAARATSIYLPTGVHPMFPRALSEGAMSLVAGAERPAVTLRVDLDESLEIIDVELTRSVVRVDRRLSYDEVDRMLDDHQDRSHAAETLGALRYIADELGAAREEAGAVAIQFPQTHLDVTFEDGVPHVELTVINKSVARSLVEEMMILVGDRVARMCSERALPIPYRAQERPHAEPTDPQILAVPAGWAREFAVLCGMQKGEVALTPRPHAGLGLPMYARATSPIRRYADLIVQRQLAAALDGAPLPYDEEALSRHLASLEQTAAEAASLEREARWFWLLHLLQDRVGETFEATVLDPRGEVLVESLGLRTRAQFRDVPSPGARVRLRLDQALPQERILALRG